MKEHYQRGWIEVDLDAIRSNVLALKKKLSPATDILAVIKADGYGHGAIPVGKELEEMSCVYGFAVATPEEAFSLRAGGIKKPILVLGYSFPYAYERLIKEQIDITLFRADETARLEQCAKGLHTAARVHIKVDTGMTRLGIVPDEHGEALVKKILQAEHLILQGMFTHFARADEADKTRTNEQLKLFYAFADRIEAGLGCRIPIKHCSNSAGIIDGEMLPGYPADLARAGIAVYGLWPSEEVNRSGLQLLPALSFHSSIVMLKEVPAGVEVSYGGCFITNQKTRIATIPIGYADGYPRSLSGRGHVLIGGRKAPILGRICMDYFMADVTGIPNIREGDRVTLIGTYGSEQITAESVSKQSGRFHYELVCDFGKRIPRVYTKGGVEVSCADCLQD